MSSLFGSSVRLTFGFAYAKDEWRQKKNMRNIHKSTICHERNWNRETHTHKIGEGFWDVHTQNKKRWSETKLNKPFGTLSDHKMTKCLHDGAIKSSTLWSYVKMLSICRMWNHCDCLFLDTFRYIKSTYIANNNRTA